MAAALGSTFRRCSCRDEQGKPYGQQCPKLKNGRRHGQWGWRIELPADKHGERRPRRRGGFATRDDAQNELDHARELLALAEDDDTDTARKIGDVIAKALTNKEPLPDIDVIRRLVRAEAPALEHPLMDEVFDAFLDGKKGKIAHNTWRSYESHIRLYLRPHLAHIRRDKLRVGHLDGMFDAIVEHNELIGQYRASGDPRKIAAVKYQRPVGPSSLGAIRDTLRATLAPSVKQGLLPINVATLVELPPAERPTPKVWTPERVQRWRETGEIPGPVVVWTPELTGEFLDHIVHHPLYPLFHLIAHTGLRRGEACGQRRSDTYLDAAALEVANQIVQYGWDTAQTPPKTTNSEGLVALDADTVLVLRDQCARQDEAKARLGADWVDSGLLFTEPDGSPLHPADVTNTFKHLVAEAGLPPIRLHDLRHGAATLSLAAGNDMKVVQHMLRHSSITITMDTYTNVLPQVAQAAAEATAKIIPRRTPRTLGLPSGTQETAMDSQPGDEKALESKKPQVNNDADLRLKGAPSGTRTPNPLVKSQLLCRLS